MSPASMRGTYAALARMRARTEAGAPPEQVWTVLPPGYEVRRVRLAGRTVRFRWVRPSRYGRSGPDHETEPRAVRAAWADWEQDEADEREV